MRDKGGAAVDGTKRLEVLDAFREIYDDTVT
jgi:hypothetical protein